MQPFSLPIYSVANKSQVLRTPVFKNLKHEIKVQKNFLNENQKKVVAFLNICFQFTFYLDFTKILVVKKQKIVLNNKCMPSKSFQYFKYFTVDYNF